MCDGGGVEGRHKWRMESVDGIHSNSMHFWWCSDNADAQEPVKTKSLMASDT